jgi:hypothetical protein
MPPSDRETGVSEAPPQNDGAAAWPPQEAAPPEDKPAATEKATAEASEAEPAKAEPAPASEPTAEPVKTEPVKTEPVKTEPVNAEAVKAEPVNAEPAANGTPAEGGGGAALPAEEMPFSNSTLHWLDDADQGGEEDPSHRITVPGYDPRAPIAGRKRGVLVVGGAGALALLVTGVLYLMAPKHNATPETAAAPAEPARELTTRAEGALAANKTGEALDLARLALVADPRFADAHFIVGSCDKARNEVPAAREEFRRYLELAPLGTHAAAAREALAALPP